MKCKKHKSKETKSDTGKIEVVSAVEEKDDYTDDRLRHVNWRPPVGDIKDIDVIIGEASIVDVIMDDVYNNTVHDKA